MSSNIKEHKRTTQFGLESNGSKAEEENTMELLRDTSTLNVLRIKDLWSSTKRYSSVIDSRQLSSEDILDLNKCIMPKIYMKNLDSLRKNST